MRFLLDANVISEVRKKTPSPKVLTWLDQNEAACATSELVIGELMKGAWNLPNENRRKATLAWANAIAESFSEGRLLSLDRNTIEIWAKVSGENLRRGRRLSVMDSLLAATALAHELTVITRNGMDFPDEVAVFNPWPKSDG